MASNWWRQFALVAVAGLAAAAPAHSQEQPATQGSSGDWRHSVFLYGMGALIEGDARIGPVQVPVDVSLSDFADLLKFGAMAAYRAENDDWSFTGDVTYMNLGQANSTQQGRASGRIDLEQLTAMATVGRRVLPHLEALVSVAYFDLSTDLRVRLLQQTITASRDADWVDGLIGFNYQVPISSRWSYTLRGDIGAGGSDLTWHALTKFSYQQSDRFGWYVGYRVIAYDYEDGSGPNLQHYDLRQHGPGAGISFSF